VANQGNLQPLRRIGAILRPHMEGERGSLALGMFLGLLLVALQVLQPWPLKWILDSLTAAGGSSRITGWVTEAPARGMIVLAVAFVGIGIAAAAAQYYQVLVLYGAGNRVLSRFRTALPLAFHESHEVGELLTRVVYDTSRLRRGLNLILTRIVQTVALFVTTTIVLLLLDPILGVVLAIGGTLALASMRKRGRTIAIASKKKRKREGALAALVANELLSIRELQASGASEGAVRKRFARSNRKSLREEQKVRRLAAGLTLKVETLLAFSIAIALWLGTRAVQSGDLTPGDLVVFFSYAVTLRTPFARFAKQTAQLGRTWACGERLTRLAERIPEIVDEVGAVDAPPFRGRVTFDSVGVQTPARRRTGRKWALDGISCELPEGSRVAVLGSNGAGKSTLLRLLLRLADPQSGRVLMDGVDLKTFTLGSVRTQISVVFQDTVLSGLTVRENISLGLFDPTPEEISAAAERACLTDFVRQLPAGFDTPVYRGGTLFSGGERQRIALARALLRDGQVWLLDEPLAGLDQATADELTTVLFDVTEGRTSLWVTHDPMLVPLFDQVVVLDYGKLAFGGAPDEYLDWLRRLGDRVRKPSALEIGP